MKLRINLGKAVSLNLPAVSNLWWHNIKTSFNAALSRAGIKDFKFHDFRHTFASQLVMRGANLKEVQELLGHKHINMTMRYAHLSKESKKKAVNLLNGFTASNASSESTCHKSVTTSDVTPRKLNRGDRI
ncbi:MAG: site-specific integrase [Syntrophobacteraceae bacterium]